MKLLLAATLVTLVVGCQGTSVPDAEGDANESVEHIEFPSDDTWDGEFYRRISGHVPTTGPDPITYQIYNQFEDQRSSWEGPNGEAPMPFGGGPFGPWDVGGPSGSYDMVMPGSILIEDEPHTLIHYLCANVGLNVSVDGDFKISRSVPAPRPITRERVLRFLHDQCELQGFDMKHDGDWVIITKREKDVKPHVVAANTDGRYDAEFKDVDAAKAIMSVASVSQTEVSISRPKGMPHKTGGRVTLSVRNATPHYILNEIARQAGLDIEYIEGAYHFSLPEDE